MFFFSKVLDPVVALIFIAMLDVFLFLLIGAWTVGGGEIMMTGLIAQGIAGESLTGIAYWNRVFVPDPGNWKIYSSLGMLLGAVIGAAVSGEFELRFPRHRSEWILTALGGLFMGVGIQLAFVCNVGAFFGLVPQINLGGYLAIGGILIGAWVGSLIYKKTLGL